jgi:glucose-1-phosphate thymidylyltransferase
MKGLILAGGTGSRLYPSTVVTNKHLLTIYDKPLIYYPLSTLLMAGATDIAIVSSQGQLDNFRAILGNGTEFGIKISYLPQISSNGIVGAIQSASSFLKEDNALIILGDNIFFGGGIGASFTNISSSDRAKVWVKKVSNPEDYGIITIDETGVPRSIVEKPSKSQSDLAVTGLYYFPKSFSGRLEDITPSRRNELEITSLIETYLHQNSLDVNHLSRGTAWFDAGTPERLFMAADYVRILQERSGEIVGAPEEVALRIGLISQHSFDLTVANMPASNYKDQLREVTLRDILVGEQ